MVDIRSITERLIAFRDARNWSQFHNPKDCALSLSLEAAEVLEHFQWKNGEELNQYVRDNKDEIGDELIDVLYWVLLMSHDLDIDIQSAFERKMSKNEAKYPVEKASGKHTKYSDL